MPELPEVETICRSLRTAIVGKMIKDVIVNHEKPLRGIDTSVFRQHQIGKKVVSIDRRGKQLLVNMSGKMVLIIHLKMSGTLTVAEAWEQPQKHTHCIWKFSDGSQLFFRDPRRFGYVILSDSSSLNERPEINSLGIEPLPILDTAVLHEAAVRTKRPIKAVLMDQRVVTGIGNIYADEICHEAGIDPMTPAETLTYAQLGKICRSTPIILRAAIDAGGTTIRDYKSTDGRQGKYALKLKVYGKQDCGSCRSRLHTSKINGRTTYYCPKCQKPSGRQ